MRGRVLDPVKRDDMRVQQARQRQVFASAAARDFEHDRAVAQGALPGQENATLRTASEFSEHFKVSQGRHVGFARLSDARRQLAAGMNQVLHFFLQVGEASSQLGGTDRLARLLTQTDLFAKQPQDDLRTAAKGRVASQKLLHGCPFTTAPAVRHLVGEAGRKRADVLPARFGLAYQ